MLLFLCSIEKWHKHLKYDENEQSSSNSSYLFKSTSVLYQVALISELVLCTYFWVWMWCIATDPSHMTKKEILSKIWYDLVQDLGNYDHSVPLILLIIEFFINNIPFTYSVFLLTECFLVVYVIF